MRDVAMLLKPGPATVIASLLVGVATFAGVLLYGPEAARSFDSAEAPAGPWVHRDSVDRRVRASLIAGDDARATTTLVEQLREDKNWDGGWMLLGQISRRAGGDPELVRRADEHLVRLMRDGQLWADGQGGYRRYFRLGWALLAAGDTDASRDAWMTGFAEREQIQWGGDITRLYDGARFLALAGDLDGAADRIAELAIAGYTRADWLSVDPDLDALRGHPVFETAVDRITEELAIAQREAVTP